MKQSVLTAFYTPKEIPETIWSVMGELNLKPEKVLEPSAGMGVFIDTMRTVNPKAQVTAFEKDKLTGLLLSKLHANEGMDIRVEGFERIQKSELGKFDLAISNIPFGDTKVFDPEYSNSKSILTAKCLFILLTIPRTFMMVTPNRHAISPAVIQTS